MDTNDTTSGTDRAAGFCRIRVQGHLDQRWTSWFDGLTISYDGRGTTVLQGQVPDQAALHGLLGKVRDIGLPLISVTHEELS